MNLVPVLVILTSVLEILSPVDCGLSLGDVVHPLGDLGLSLGDLVHGPGRGSCSDLWSPADR